MSGYFTRSMFQSLTSEERALAIRRLTALWALNECGIGGILHALNSPLSGLVVGSFAMICIALICALAENRWRAVMSSLLIVLVIKALVSPHTSPTAYLAVSFQGVSGALIYGSIRYLLPSSILFFVIGHIESAMQRIIVLTLLYGTALWEAIDIWGNWIAGKWGVIIPLKSSSLLIATYLSIHFLAGMLTGWLTYRILKAVNRNWGDATFRLSLKAGDRKELIPKRKKGKRWKRYIIAGILLILIALAYISPIAGAGGMQKALIAVLRAVVILALWFGFIAPWLISILQRFLKIKRQRLAHEVEETMAMFPRLLWIIDKAWTNAKHLRGLSRWKVFFVHTILYILQYRTVDDSAPDGTDM